MSGSAATTTTRHRVASGCLDGADLHDGASAGEDLRGLHARVVLGAADDEEAGKLLHRLRERPVGDHRGRMGSAPDRPRLAAVGEPGATGHGPAMRLEQLYELRVGVERDLMI